MAIKLSRHFKIQFLIWGNCSETFKTLTSYDNLNSYYSQENNEQYIQRKKIIFLVEPLHWLQTIERFQIMDMKTSLKIFSSHLCVYHEKCGHICCTAFELYLKISCPKFDL